VSAPTPEPPDAIWLSILLPVYDVGPALDECVRSILDQQVGGIELVFVDDASPGDDLSRLRAWQARHPDRIRVVVHARNAGVSEARNTLLSHAHGTYVWFVDPDDLVEPQALASLKRIVDTSRPDLILCDFRTFSESSATRRPHVCSFEEASNVLSDRRESLVKGLFRTGQLHPWTKIARRAAWPEDLRFPAGRVFEDLAVYPRLALAARTHFHAPEVWIAYRQRAGSILATLDDRKLEDWTMALTGYARDMAATGLQHDADTDFEVSHFCARTALRAMRRYRRLHPGADTRAAFGLYLARWRDSSPLDSTQLLRAYLARRMWGRWAQWAWTTWRITR